MTLKEFKSIIAKFNNIHEDTEVYIHINGKDIPITTMLIHFEKGADIMKLNYTDARIRLQGDENTPC